LQQAIEKARRLVKAAPKPVLNKVRGRRGSDIYLLDPAEIIAFQAEGEIVHILTQGHKYLAEATLKELEKETALTKFRRIHRGTLINADHIRKISPLSSRRWMLTMSNGFEAIVSKRLARSIR
jgi:DNA-binding LytR/AlgR family response regulator